MHYTPKTRFLAMILAIVMVMGMVPMSTFATENAETAVVVDAGDFSSPDIVYTPHDDYYKVISKTDYVLAPGITESEIVLNNAAGSHPSPHMTIWSRFSSSMPNIQAAFGMFHV